jgi:DMSO reductase anchor subunit
MPKYVFPPSGGNERKSLIIWIIVYAVLGLLMYISYFAILSVKKYPGKDKEITYVRSSVVYWLVGISLALFIGSGVSVAFGQATIGTVLLLISIILDFIVGSIVGTAIENADGSISTDAALGYATTAPYIIKVCLLVVSVALAASGDDTDKVGRKIGSFGLARPELARGE